MPGIFDFINDAYNKMIEAGKNGFAQLDDAFGWLNEADPALQQLFSQYGGPGGLANAWKSIGKLDEGMDLMNQFKDLYQSGDYNGLLGLFSNSGFSRVLDNSGFMSWLNNKISQQNVNAANEYQAGREDTALVRQAEQLASLGLGASNVLSIGGAGSGSAGPAQVDRSAAQSAAHMKAEKFKAQEMLTRSILRMITGMASAGIGGGALLASKKAAAQLGAKSARSALTVSRDLSTLARHQTFIDNNRNKVTETEEIPDWDDMMRQLGQ